MTQPDIFDRAARRRVFDRATSSPAHDQWLIQTMADELIERLDGVRQTFTRALVLGHAGEAVAAALRAKGIWVVHAVPGISSRAITCDEDRLPFCDASFDLVLAIGTLDTVNDLPGALILIRRILQPGSLFMAALSGAGCLPTLRYALSRLDGRDAAIARLHPAIDVRAAGDLLSRAGFQMPVADNNSLDANFRTSEQLFADVRANGMSNVLLQRAPITRQGYRQLSSTLGKAPVTETFSILHLTGWSSDAQSSG
jgi:NADH dehydrogenase [ubiquinone] 1 alpha subcomplex assembly factor 5